MSDGGDHHEIVIIKRHSGGHEDEHHGGVWKIAFADFMTAMMAFFLVMWLISANDKTKAVIARYFNPVQLVDSTPQPKGLEDPKAGAPSVMPKPGTPRAEPKAEEAKSSAEAKDAKGAKESKGQSSKDSKTTGAAAQHEAELFQDPYAVLAEIAKSDADPVREKRKSPSDGAKGGAGAIGIKGGTAYRDPFDPAPLRPAAPDAPSFHPGEDASPGAAGQPTAADQPPADATGPKPVASTVTADTGNQSALGASHATAQPAAGNSGAPASAASATTPASGSTPAPQTLLGRIETAVDSVQGRPNAADAPKVEIKQTAEGTLIDLTDGSDFSMFASGSAEPAPKMVHLLEKIGRVLMMEEGLITIRGFTDARPFRSEAYDNWRLSSARADMAHYMLARGGVDEQRFERIEGYADRKPKNAKDPNAAENRRIEILVRSAAP